MGTTRLNLISLTTLPKSIERLKSIASEFDYSYANIETPDEIIDLDSKYHDVKMGIFDMISEPNISKITQYIQGIKFAFPDLFILLISHSKISPAEIHYMKNSGVNIIITETDFHETSKVEYITSQIIRAAFVPAKVNEFDAGTKLDFTLYHLMPLAQRLMPIIPKGAEITKARLAKLEGIGELFIKRDDIPKYVTYCNRPEDRSAEGLTKRCRSRYLSLCHSHSKLVFNLIDQSDSATFKEGKAIYETCEALSKELLYALTLTGEPWSIVNNSAMGEFGSTERSPTVAAYAGTICVNAQFDNPVPIMMASLICDLGMLELPPKVMTKIRKASGTSTLTPEELKLYHNHPKRSLGVCLDKKLSLDNSLRDIILYTHERKDGLGFPDQRSDGPVESMVILFAEMVDTAAMLTMGRARKPIEEIRKEVVAREIADAKIFSYNFLLKMKNALA